MKSRRLWTALKQIFWKEPVLECSELMAHEKLLGIQDHSEGLWPYLLQMSSLHCACASPLKGGSHTLVTEILDLCMAISQGTP